MGGKAKPGSGGRREGSGRPRLYEEATAPVRLPASLVEPLRALLAAKGLPNVLAIVEREGKK